MEDFIGRQIGQYEITGKIGEGGMAQVYRARQESLDREIALKILLPELTRNTIFIERFLREARAAAKMMHPNIVTIYEVGEVNGIYYMAMPYIEGRSLAEIIQQQGALAPGRVARITSQIAGALDYAHRQGIIHRDVKPGNILIMQDDYALLTDFGIAKAAEESSGLTRTGTMVGTPAYMAPEQARGLTGSPYTDQYSLGVVVYEALSGRPPFVSDTSQSTLYRHVHEAPDLSSIPLLYQTVLQRALAKEEGVRFGSVSEFAQELQNTVQRLATSPAPGTPLPGALAGYVVSPPYGTPAPASQEGLKPVKKTFPVWVWAGAAAVLVVALLLFMTMFNGNNSTPVAGTQPGASAGATGRTPAAEEAPLTSEGEQIGVASTGVLATESASANVEEEQDKPAATGLPPEPTAALPVATKTVEAAEAVGQLAATAVAERATTGTAEAEIAMAAQANAEAEQAATLETQTVPAMAAATGTAQAAALATAQEQATAMTNATGTAQAIATATAGFAATGTAEAAMIITVQAEAAATARAQATGTAQAVAAVTAQAAAISTARAEAVAEVMATAEAERAATEAVEATSQAVQAATETARESKKATQSAQLARLTPTAMPTPTPTATPTPTPSPAMAALPTATVGAGATPLSPPAASGGTAVAVALPEASFQNFEVNSTWRRGDQANGELSNSTSKVHGGQSAGQLSYRFSSPDNDFVVFMQSHSLQGQPNAISAWVYGDGSGHYLNVWVKDAQGQVWQSPLGQVKHTGWQRMVAWLDSNGEWPHGHISGSDNGAIDYPISFNALVLDDIPDSYTGQGTIFIDDLASFTGTPAKLDLDEEDSLTPADVEAPDLKAEPAKLTGRIAFPVENNLGYYDIWMIALPDGQPYLAIQGARQVNFQKKDGRILVNGEQNPEGMNNVILSTSYLESKGMISDSPYDEYPTWNPEGDRFVMGNSHLLPGNDRAFMYIQCTLKRPQFEETAQCQDVARYGALGVGAGGEVIGMSPVWMADGSSMIAFRGTGGVTQNGIYVIGSWATLNDGGSQRPELLVKTSHGIPADSDRSRLYFFADDLHGNWEIYAIQLNGQGLVNLTNSPKTIEGLPTVSPDGRWLAFVSDREGKWAIYAMPVTGGPVQKVVDFPEANPWGGGQNDWTTERISWGPS